MEKITATDGDSAIINLDLDAFDALCAEAFSYDPEPPTPAAPNFVTFRPRRFDRVEHCRRIGAHGGNATVARHGAAHLAATGRAGTRSTIERHGVAFLRAIVAAKGWAGSQRPKLGADLAAGEWLADLAAQTDRTGTAGDGRPRARRRTTETGPAPAAGQVTAATAAMTPTIPTPSAVATNWSFVRPPATAASSASVSSRPPLEGQRAPLALDPCPHVVERDGLVAAGVEHRPLGRRRRRRRDAGERRRSGRRCGDS